MKGEQQVEKTCEVFPILLFLLEWRARRDYSPLWGSPCGATGKAGVLRRYAACRTPDRLVLSQSTHFYLLY